MIWGFFRCLILPHQPDRRRVKKVSNDVYYGYCAHCGTRIRRLARDRWVRTSDWPASAPE